VSVHGTASVQPIGSASGNTGVDMGLKITIKDTDGVEWGLLLLTSEFMSCARCGSKFRHERMAYAEGHQPFMRLTDRRALRPVHMHCVRRQL